MQVGTTDVLTARAELSFSEGDTLSYVSGSAELTNALTVTEEGYLNYKASSTDEGATSTTRVLNFFANDKAAFGQAQVGSVYVFEYKLRVNKMVNGANKTTSWWSYSGVAFDNGGSYTAGITESYFALAINNINSSNVYNVHINNAKLALTAGEWYYIREEVRLTAFDAATGKYTAEISTYMNGYCQAAGASNKTIVGNALCAGFLIRSVINSGYGHLNEIDIDLDDIAFSAYNTLPLAQ